MLRQNPDVCPIFRRRSYWATAVGTDIALAYQNLCPREIRVNRGGDLAVTYIDGTSEVIKSIPDGAIFVDSCWASIQATSSTAYAISVGW